MSTPEPRRTTGCPQGCATRAADESRHFAEPDAGRDPALITVKDVLSRHPRIALAIVFGSVAAARARPDSDIDLAVSADRPLSKEERMALIGDIAKATGRPVDLVDLAQVGEPLLGRILSGGKRILGDDERFAGLLVRHLFDEADFLPYRNRILAERRRAWIGR